MEEIRNYKRISLEPNVPQIYKLVYVREITIANNSTTSEVEISIGGNRDSFALLPNKTITKNDLYNQNTTIRLQSSDIAEVEIVLNGDIRSNIINSSSGGVISPPYDDTEVRNLIQTNTTDISNLKTKTTTNTNDITTLKGKVNTLESNVNTLNPNNIAPIVDSQTYTSIQPGSNGIIDISSWSDKELYQKRYICATPLTSDTTITLPQLSDDIDMNPPAPPSHPQIVPDINKNNFIEVLLQVNSSITLHYQDGGNFEGDFILTRGKYKFTAKYNLLSYDWQVNIYNLDNRIQNYSYTISDQEPNNSDGKPDGHIWYKI